jgi:hypothetical protein
MFKTAIHYGLVAQVLFFGLSLPSLAQTSGEKKQVCEARPIMKCLDKAKIEGKTLRVSSDDMAISSDGFKICDSSYNYTEAPDIVLIMDNTGSMDSFQVVAGIPRWCAYPDREVNDSGCISGDPRRQRGPALQTFLDSALVKGGNGVNVGVVTFSEIAEAKSTKLLPLTEATRDAIKASIVMKQDGETNYTAAFRAAMNLMLTSKKPKALQFIIFVSDGRPNFPKRPDGDPYMYKDFWDSLPTVHSIFLGDNKSNYKDMQEISAHTGGFFFNISNVGLLAKILTDDLAKKLFRRASPTLTTVRNATEAVTLRIEGDRHIISPDSSTYTLQLPGPMYLRRGLNEIIIKTEYGYSGTTQDVHFNIERIGSGPLTDFEEACRDYPKLVLYNTQNEAINFLGLPYTINDSLLRYTLTTKATGLDSFNVVIKTVSTVTSQKDLEIVLNTEANHRDSSWSNSEPFKHLTITKTPGDRLVQVAHGEMVLVTYINPYIPEDSVQVQVRIKYGPEFDKAAYWDLDADGRIETVDIRFLEQISGLPNQLKFHIEDALGVGVDRIAKLSDNEIAYGHKTDNSEDKSHLIVTLTNPFPYGVTSVAHPDTSGRTFEQLSIPLVDGSFRVDDSVPPVILKADVKGPDKDSPLTHVVVTYSEPITLDLSIAIEPVVFKRDTVIFTTSQMPVERVQKVNETQYVFHLKAGGEFTPVGGDFVAINNNGETRDLSRRAPSERTFAPIGGAVPSQGVSDFYVTFANGSRSNAQSVSNDANQEHILIPVDGNGYPLPGSIDGKCGSCISKEGDIFAGSVIVVVTKFPVNYDFSIYSNLGQLVARSGGKIDEEDLRLLEKREDPSRDPNLTQYTQRIVWTGRTFDGQMAGTGAYVLKATFKYEQSFKTGARPSMSTKFTKFGFLRNCCNVENSRWP